MANEEHLKWLKEGVEAWNERRRETLFIPDFRGATIINGSLIGSVMVNNSINGTVIAYDNFSDLDLSGADVRSNYSLIEGDVFPHPESFQRATLNILGITQHQLDSMIGDSGTIIPDLLTRPDHWEVLPWHQEDAGQNDPETDDTFEDAPQYDPTEKPREYYQHLALNLTREPIRSVAVLEAYGQQLATATRMYRDTHQMIPDDVILIEQITSTMANMAAVVQSETAELEDHIIELEAQITKLNETIKIQAMALNNGDQTVKKPR